MKIKYVNLPQQYKVERKRLLSVIDKTLATGQYVGGDQVQKFEKNISKLLKVKYCVALNSGTDALTLGLHAIGVRRNDEVITPPNSFVASTAVIVHLGAKPVFVDVKDDQCIDPDLIEKAITKKTRAIMPVHWAGRICEMKKINQISKKYKIPVVEDSCHAILGEYHGKLAGSFGAFGCFSMHPLKNLNVWGDGGFVVCSNKRLYKKMKLLRNHGLVSRDKNLIFGYNSRLDTVQAVVAINALKKLNNITRQRINNSKFLDKIFQKNENIILPERKKNIKEVFHLYHLRLKTKKLRNKILRELIKNKIDGKIHYPTSMHLQPAAKKYKYSKGDFPIAEQLSETSISLPVHEFVLKKDLLNMCNIIFKSLKK